MTRVPAARRPALGLARTFQNIALFEGMTVLDNIKLGAHCHLRTGVLGALTYGGAARAEEAALREEVEREIIDFLEIEHLREPVGRQPLLRPAEAGRAGPGPGHAPAGSCSSTSPSPG